MRLQIELVPKALWGSNFRKRIGITDWRIISKYVRQSNNDTCYYCGSKENTECHEEWNYHICMGNRTGEQVLNAFRCVCKKCHGVIHWGRSSTVLSKDKLSELKRHAIKVNNTNSKAWSYHKLFQQMDWRKANEMVDTWIQNYRGL